jgi:hypothetical protein
MSKSTAVCEGKRITFAISVLTAVVHGIRNRMNQRSELHQPQDFDFDKDFFGYFFRSLNPASAESKVRDFLGKKVTPNTAGFDSGKISFPQWGFGSFFLGKKVAPQNPKQSDPDEIASP